MKLQNTTGSSPVTPANFPLRYLVIARVKSCQKHWDNGACNIEIH